jgi:hypothetical protein
MPTQIARGQGIYVNQYPAGTDISSITIPGSSTEDPSADQDQDISLPDAPNTRKSARQSDMSKPVLFYGKPGQLDAILTHCLVKFIAEDTPDSKKAATLSQHFRGPALLWLQQKLKKNPQYLVSWDAFSEDLQATSGLDETAVKQQAARKLASCRQTSSVQDYATRFTALSSEAGIPDETANALFIKGLRPNVRNACIISDQNDTLADAIAEAQRIDNQLFYARTFQPSAGGGRRNNPRRGKRTSTPFIKHEH